MSATQPSDKDHAEPEKDVDDEKIVEVPPVDGDSIPIQGIDPEPDR